MVVTNERSGATGAGPFVPYRISAFTFSRPQQSALRDGAGFPALPGPY
jgi:hypothetical protein